MKKIKIIIAQPVSILYLLKMLILTFEEINNKFNIDNNAIRISE